MNRKLKIPAVGAAVKKFFEKLVPVPQIGGLEIGDGGLRFLALSGGRVTKAALRLPPGIIGDGKILDKQNFVSALKKLRTEIASRYPRKLYVVVSLEASGIFVQQFGLPEIPAESFDEAVDLNLQMISPIKAGEAYYDWQPIGGEAIDGFQLEFLGGFVNKAVIDDLLACLKEAKFVPAAVEFPALSLSRLVKTAGAGVDFKEPQVIIAASPAGLIFMILKDGNLYFQYYRPWAAIYGEARQVTASVFEESVKTEISKVLNFYSTKMKRDATGVVLAAEGLGDEIAGIIKRNFSVALKPLSLERFGDLEPAWFKALGAALRGTLPWSEDNFISLAGTGVREEFERNKTLHFISFWRSVILSSLAFSAFVFFLTDSFLGRDLEFYRNALSRNIESPQARTEVGNLEKEAAKFNDLVAALEKVKSVHRRWSPLFSKLAEISGGRISFDRIFVQSFSAPVILSGRGESEEAIVGFKNAINDQPQFSEAALPLAGVVQEVSGGFSFSLTFKIDNLNF